MRRHLSLLFLAVVVLVALWFLQRGNDTAESASPAASSAAPSSAAPVLPTSPTSEAAPSSPTSSSSAPSSPSISTIAPAPDNPVEPDGEQVNPTAGATPRDQTQAALFTAYAAAAESFMADFARPALKTSDQQWWAKVKPHLSEEAASAYAGTDPQNVPFSTVTSAATILPSEAPSELLTIARIHTDAGWYRVELNRSEVGIRVTRAALEAASQ